MLWAMGGVALLVLLGVWIEQHVDTDTKRVRRTLEAAAAGSQANDATQVYACIVADADGDVRTDRDRSSLAASQVPGTNDPRSSS